MEQMNKIYFDREAKEYVLVTNGICTLDHSNPETFATSHANGMGSCEYVPHEGIALRPFVDEKTGLVSIAWTYRGIDWAQMDHEPSESAKASFDYVFQHRRSNRFIGRI